MPLASDSFIPSEDTMIALTSSRWSKQFLFTGFSAEVADCILHFVLKITPNEDGDDQSLIVLKMDVDSGEGGEIVIFKGSSTVPESIAEAGKIVVDTVNPLNISVTLKAEAMNIPPSETNSPYTYEISCFKSGDKEILARGSFIAGRSVLRSITAL